MPTASPWSWSASSTGTSGGAAELRRPQNTLAPTARRAEKLWEPTPERIERATMTRYMRWLEHERGPEFGSYEELWRWSVDELEDFWGSIWEFFDVRSSGSHEQVLAERVMPGRALVRGRRAQLRRAHLPHRAGRRRRRPATPPSCASWPS